VVAEVAVVGDVHGDIRRLEQALATLPETARTIVFVGDYVNRGYHSKAVIDALIAAKSALGSRLRLLRGNHEAALLTFLHTGDLVQFAQIGGLPTIRSYLLRPLPDVVETFRQAFPVEHLGFLNSTETCFEAPGLLASHAGFDPDTPNSRDYSAMVTGHFPDIFRVAALQPALLAVCGHYVQYTLRPFVSPHFICLDTGCGTLPGAPLTALLLPDCRFMSFS
jgi:serine/threonine protein phosphatase 1